MLFTNGSRKKMKALFKTSGVFYFSILFYLFFLARRRPRPTFYKKILPHNIIPFKNKFQDLLSYHSMSAYERWNFCTDLFGNIILFIPMPFFLAMVFNIKSPVKLFFIALCISTAVEICQYVLSIGVADIDDIILNMAGTCIGIAALKLLNSFRLPYRLSAGKNL